MADSKISPTKNFPTMTIPEIVKAYPETLAVFERFGLHPDGYKALQYEDLSATAKVHQLKLDDLLAELNKVLA